MNFKSLSLIAAAVSLLVSFSAYSYRGWKELSQKEKDCLRLLDITHANTPDLAVRIEDVCTPETTLGIARWLSELPDYPYTPVLGIYGTDGWLEAPSEAEVLLTLPLILPSSGTENLNVPFTPRGQPNFIVSLIQRNFFHALSLFLEYPSVDPNYQLPEMRNDYSPTGLEFAIEHRNIPAVAILLRRADIEITPRARKLAQGEEPAAQKIRKLIKEHENAAKNKKANAEGSFELLPISGVPKFSPIPQREYFQRELPPLRIGIEGSPIGKPAAPVAAGRQPDPWATHGIAYLAGILTMMLPEAISRFKQQAAAPAPEKKKEL